MLTNKQLNGKITRLGTAERTTKQLLGELSRELLEHIVMHNDVTLINKLLSVLTPMNQRTSCLFFKAFIPFYFNESTGMFEKMKKNKKEACRDAIMGFLEDDDNTIWTWASENVQVEKKKVDWSKRLTHDFKKALEDGFTLEQILDILNQVVPEELDIQEAA